MGFRGWVALLWLVTGTFAGERALAQNRPGVDFCNLSAERVTFAVIYPQTDERGRTFLEGLGWLPLEPGACIGRGLSGDYSGRTIHMRVRHFLADGKIRIEKGNVRFCATEDANFIVRGPELQNCRPGYMALGFFPVEITKRNSIIDIR